MLLDDDDLQTVRKLAGRDRRHSKGRRRGERRWLREVDRCRHHWRGWQWRRRRGQRRAGAGGQGGEAGERRQGARHGPHHSVPPVTMRSFFPWGTTVSTTFGLVRYWAATCCTSAAVT